MGGSVSTAFRFADGKVDCLELWTNPLPRFLKSKNIIVDKNEDMVRDFIKENEEIGNAHIPLAPLEYGLNVIDFQKNVFLTMQGHANFNWFSSLEANGKADKDRAENFMALVEAGRIECVRSIFDDNKETTKETTLMIESREQAEQVLALARQTVDSNPFRVKAWYNFRIIFEPTMAFQEFAETAEGARQFRQKLIDLGFVLDDKANAIWDNFISEYEEYDDE